MRLVDTICAELGGFEGCVTPICLPTGCSDGVYVQPCLEGGVCDVETGVCEQSEGCPNACADYSNPCAEAFCNDVRCDQTQNDPCHSDTPCTTGYCDLSQGEPRCGIRPDPECVPPIDLPVPAR
jgi:hypothetical protein